MQTVGAGPSANSDQKFTACENERFDWLRPSGRSIFAADVITASAISTANRIGRSRLQVREREGESSGAGNHHDRRRIRAPSQAARRTWTSRRRVSSRTSLGGQWNVSTGERGACRKE